NHITYQSLKLWVLGPCINLGVGERRVEVRLKTFVGVTSGITHVTGRTVIVRRVSTASNCGTDTNANLLALDVIDADHVDAGEEVTGFLNPLLQLLLDSRLYRKGFRRAFNAVELRNPATELVKQYS